MTANDETPTTEAESGTERLSRADHEDGRDRSSTDESSARIPLERRDYLRSIGVAGALGSLGALSGATGGVAAQDQDGDWEAAADERIQEHRTGDLEVVVEDENGNPISGADVHVELQEHDFGFGTAVNAGTLINESSEGDEYREYIPELFNKAVLENQHKWRFWEDDTQLADDATDWLLDRGLDVRGHVCIWGATQHNAVPADVETAIDNNDAETIRQRTMDHIEEVITHYGDDIEEWEVVNEVLHEHALVEGVYGDQVDLDEPWAGEVVPWRSEILADWYLKAQEVADQEGVDIAVNDFNTLGGQWDYTRDWYPEQIEFLLDNGVDLDGIGFQSHIAAHDAPVGGNDDPDERMSYEQINEILDEYADYGAGLRITEFDTFGGDDWSGDEEKAEVLYTYLKTAFSHPAVDDFLMWGFWDGRHWEDDAPLFDQNWNPKPAYDVWTDLVFEEWWTEESGQADTSGTYTTPAFLGEYEITVTTDEGSTTTTIDVTDADGTTTVDVTADGDGNGNGDPNGDGPPEIDGYQPADTTGDGLYNDITGSGSTTTTDVNVFFENIDNPDVADYPQYYDFDGNGQVSVTDVVELFESI
ncbi:endo-1,4-beta-xylanase [Natronoglomus mannanivorans]|uniref:endo-1,4-beta-xylanase n=1 Tax=Natronoglomus mannanivorans TaxID=2979990 RepID=A0AAP3E0Q4_9EURY|nr:endo-1,4-beta-xylanase [Halobacteria archaeon AArc-xg1-1]